MTLLACTTDAAQSNAALFEKKSTSHVWKYFRRHQKKADCLLCNKTFCYNGGTSDLISHLNRKHPSIIKHKEEEGCPANTLTQQLPIGDFTKIRPPGSKPCSINSQREITHILSRCPWLDMRPLSIVRDRGLKGCSTFWSQTTSTTTHVSILILMMVKLPCQYCCVMPIQ